MVGAPALVLKPRDRWIGRDAADRKAHLDRMVGLARFLIRPGLACRTLASTVLGLCLGRLADDNAARYGVAPLPVETFVGPAHGGISLRATNRIHVGMTAGRGRCSAAGAQVPAKGIRMYPLVRDWRRRLGVAGPAVLLPPQSAWRLAPGEGLDRDHWAQTEFGGAPVGKAALARRLVASARIQATAPMKTVFTAACGDAAAVQGSCRMIDCPDDPALTLEAILAPHRARTPCRMRAQSTVLAIQDGSDLNVATPWACKGLGVIAKARGSAGTLGLHRPTTFAVNTDGVPLGLPRIAFEAPDGQAEKSKPTADKKTQCWLQGWRDITRLTAGLANTRVIAVMDRESDAIDLFCAWRDEGGADLLVRTTHGRGLAEETTLFETMRAARGPTAFAGREARPAQCARRWQTVDLPIPKCRSSELTR